MRWLVLVVVLVLGAAPARAATLSTEITGTAFGNGHVGSVGPQTQTITVRNTDTTGNLSFTVTATLGDYGFAPASGTVAPGEELDVIVTFTAAMRGARNATITVATPDDASNPSDTFAVTGTGTSGNLTVAWTGSPGALDFGSAAVAGGMTTRTVTISNPSPANEPLTVTVAVTSGAADYSVPATVDVELAVGASMPVTVTFDPSDARTRTGVLTVTADDGFNPSDTVNLTGIGNGAVFAALPASIDFGTVSVGEFADVTLTITNTGNQSGNVTAVASGNSVFTTTVVGTALPRTLAALGTMQITVRFTPVTGAVVSSNVTVSTSGTPASLVVPVTGDGLYEDVALSATGEPDLLIDLGERRVGLAAAQSVTVTNVGETSIVLELPASDDAACTVTPAMPPALPATLAPNASATFSVDITPSAVGLGDCTITVESDIPTTDTVELTWQGIAPEVDLAAPANAMLDFGVVDVDAAQAIKTVVIDNTGGAPLTIGPCSITGSTRFAMITSCTNLSVAPNASATLMVAYDPSLESSDAATLSIGVDALSTNQIAVALAGVGADQRIDISTLSLSFPDTNVTTDDAPIGYVDIFNPVNPDTGVAETLTISMASSNNDVFTLSNTGPFTVAAGAMIRIAVTFRPDAAGTYDGVLTVISDASALPMAEIALHGRGIVTGGEESGGCCDTRSRTARPHALLSLIVLGLVLRRRRSVESAARGKSRSR